MEKETKSRSNGISNNLDYSMEHRSDPVLPIILKMELNS
jgi:hypothetical protein